MYRIIQDLDYLSLLAFAGGGSAVSQEAEAVKKVADAFMRSTERSLALFGKKAVALSTLTEMVDDCSEHGWDGEAATAIDQVAFDQARQFIRALPDNVPIPEFAPEPDGSISLDWFASQNRLFSLSIGPSNRVAFAWLDGMEKGHGVVSFDGRNVPQRVLNEVKKISGRKHAGLWVA